VAASIAAEQARLGFTVVQIAHRLETLKDSDVIYYLSHGSVVECGGEKSLRRAAVEELLKVPVEHKMVEDPESGNLVERLRAGHFHDMWNKAQGVDDSKKMALSGLETKEKELRAQLDEIEKAIKRKKTMRSLSMRLLAARAFLVTAKDGADVERNVAAPAAAAA